MFSTGQIVDEDVIGENTRWIRRSV